MKKENLTYTLAEVMAQNHICTDVLFKNNVFRCMDKSIQMLSDSAENCNLLEVSDEGLELVKQLAQLKQKMKIIKTKCIIK